MRRAHVPVINKISLVTKKMYAQKTKETWLLIKDYKSSLLRNNAIDLEAYAYSQAYV